MSLEVVIVGQDKNLKVRYFPNSDYLELDKIKYIIDLEPSATIPTKKIQPEELEDLEEGEPLPCIDVVKGTPLHFIIDSGNQKNLISTRSSRY
jgi:hypothetical protein